MDQRHQGNTISPAGQLDDVFERSSLTITLCNSCKYFPAFPLVDKGIVLKVHIAASYKAWLEHQKEHKHKQCSNTRQKGALNWHKQQFGLR